VASTERTRENRCDEGNDRGCSMARSICRHARAK
jgi:hypothetical protein